MKKQIQIEVVLDIDYDEIVTEFVPENFNRGMIKEYLHKKYGKNGWFAFDYQELE